MLDFGSMAHSSILAATNNEGPDDPRALFSPAPRNAGGPCCGCGLARRPVTDRFPGQSRHFSLLDLLVSAASTPARSTTFARGFIVNDDHQSTDVARVITLVEG